MEQTERRKYLIRRLLDEQPRYKRYGIPSDDDEQRRLLRGLMNVREAAPIDGEFREIQDAYLREEINRRGIVDAAALEPVEDGICLWRGDITRLKCGAIVNAANSGMTGCYQPCHNCIDNCIHTYAGIELRGCCAELMARQGYAEPAGRAKITPAFNLPCDYVIHTVGPIVEGALTPEHERLLASCYRACLGLAEEYQLGSIAFCCISTGVFCFPNERAAEIAVRTVREYRAKQTYGDGQRREYQAKQTYGDSHTREYQSNRHHMRIIFNVFQERDEQIYRKLLG